MSGWPGNGGDSTHSLDVMFVFVHLKLGTLGAGNHYAEIQVVDEIYNDYAAKKMGIDHRGQVCVMIHSGSRGLGHQVATGGRCTSAPCTGRRAGG